MLAYLLSFGAAASVTGFNQRFCHEWRQWLALVWLAAALLCLSVASSALADGLLLRGIVACLCARMLSLSLGVSTGLIACGFVAALDAGSGSALW